MNIKITPEPGRRYRVQSKVAKCAGLNRTVTEISLPNYLASLAELATQTHNRRSGAMLESPFAESIHG